MILTQSYYEDHDSNLPEINTFNGSVSEIVKRFDYIFVKDLETCRVTKTQVELQAQDKGSEGFYTFDISGTQEEIEGFLEAMYLEDQISWKAEFLFIPQVGGRCLRKSDSQLFFITEVDGQRVNLCSSSGEIIKNQHISQVKEQFIKN